VCSYACTRALFFFGHTGQALSVVCCLCKYPESTSLGISPNVRFCGCGRSDGCKFEPMVMKLREITRNQRSKMARRRARGRAVSVRPQRYDRSKSRSVERGGGGGEEVWLARAKDRARENCLLVNNRGGDDIIILQTRRRTRLWMSRRR